MINLHGVAIGLHITHISHMKDRIDDNNKKGLSLDEDRIDDLNKKSFATSSIPCIDIRKSLGVVLLVVCKNDFIAISAQTGQTSDFGAHDFVPIAIMIVMSIAFTNDCLRLPSRR